MSTIGSQLSSFLYPTAKSVGQANNNSQTTSAAGTASDTSNSFNWGSTSNSLFQKLLQDPSVTTINEVSQNSDGTYNINDLPEHTAYGTAAQYAVKMMVDEQNTSGHLPTDGQSKSGYTDSDEEKFKELTGYNLLQTSNGVMLIDDNGNGSGQGNERLTSLWNTFWTARGAKNLDATGSAGGPSVLARIMQRG